MPDMSTTGLTASFWEDIRDNTRQASADAIPEQMLEERLKASNVEIMTLQQKHALLKALAEREVEARKSDMNGNPDVTRRQLHLIGMLQSEEGDEVGSAATWHRLLYYNHPSHPNLSALYNLACSFEEQEKYVEAEALMRALVPLLQWKIGEHSPQAFGCMKLLAKCIFKQGRKSEASEALHVTR